jgi:hypothetical protein
MLRLKRSVAIGLLIWGCGCLVGIGYFTSLYYGDPGNPSQDEYWEGVGLCWSAGLLSWIGLPLLSWLHVRQFGKFFLIILNLPVAIAFGYFLWYWLPAFIPPLRGALGP